MDPRQFEAMAADEKSKVLAEGAEDMKKHWRVENGVIVNDGQGVYLTTDKDYGDVELFVDWKIGPQGDSGVYLRATPQVQIWDFTEPRYARWAPIRAPAACGTTARAPPARIRSFAPTTPSASGTHSISSRWCAGRRSI